MSIEQLWEGGSSPVVSDKFKRIREHLSDKGNQICTGCGTHMIRGSEGCFKCPTCGQGDCDGE